MFRKTGNEQIEMFKDISYHLTSQANKKLEEPGSWSIVFYNQYTSKIDEGPYSVLFSTSNGRPNASVRIMLSMMLLKELKGWSDEQLFDSCTFNIRVRQALGIRRMDINLPSSSTYYDFRSKLAEHLELVGKDLIGQTFNQICVEQIKEFDISGRKVRMDSKLIQSNIAHQNRLQLVVEGLRVFIKNKGIETFIEHFSDDQYKILEKLKKGSTSNLCYSLNKQEKGAMLLEIGKIIHILIGLGTVTKESILYKMFNEQYNGNETKDDQGSENDQDAEQGADQNQEEEVVSIKDPKKIGSGSIQSVHDLDAAYRKKGKGETVQVVKGYHSNITETCGQAGKPNIITDVITTAANISESDFLQPAIASTNEKLGDKQVEQVITDGGYDSKLNREALSELGMPDWKLQKLKGQILAYKIRYKEDGTLEVIERKTDQELEVNWLEKIEKYRITRINGTYLYMTNREVDNYIIAINLIGNRDEESYNLRSSVESTVHEVFHRVCKRNKIRYRGLIKSQWYVLMRAMSVNISRISRYLGKKQDDFTFLLTTCHIWLVSYITKIIGITTFAYTVALSKLF
jgi:IS5 family transposase